MGKGAYEQHMRQRLRDLGIQIASVRARLADSPDAKVSNLELKVELAGRLGLLEYRRDNLKEKLDALSAEPDGTWEDLKLQIEDEWDTLVQDFEERVASLA